MVDNLDTLPYLAHRFLLRVHGAALRKRIYHYQYIVLVLGYSGPTTADRYERHS